MNEVLINETKLQVKTWKGQRVVTFSDIDLVHKRVDGTAKRNFAETKKHLVINEDYFLINGSELKELKQSTNFVLSNARSITLLTESGYLLLVKSFTDDLAWGVQRKLVKSYFKLQEIASTSNEVQALQKDLSTVFVQINNMENLLEDQAELLSSVMDNMTISTRQQEKILKAARSRVNHLLGGAHSSEYKQFGRTYLSNLWINFKDSLHCGSSYKDLNPKDFDKAIDYISEWEYIEV